MKKENEASKKNGYYPTIYAGFIQDGYLVNPDYIKEIHGNLLILMNGEKLPIGKKYRRQLICTLPHKPQASVPEQSDGLG